MRVIIKYKISKHRKAKITLPKKSVFISLRIKNEMQLCFLSLGGPLVEKTFRLISNVKEVESVHKKQYLGSCKNLHLFEIIQ